MATPESSAAPLIAPADDPTTRSKAAAHPERLERGDHARGDDAAHAATFEHQGDAVRIVARVGNRAGLGALAQHAGDRVLGHRSRGHGFAP